jgi:tetratricopeptide (TPR) repeat protein
MRLSSNIRLLRTPLLTIVIAVSFLVYGNTLRNGFVYDDIPQVVQNPWIRDFRSISDIFSTNVWAFQGISTNYYRPLLHVIYLLSYLLFGLAPWGFHLVNILFHAGVSALVFLITSRLFPMIFSQTFPVSRFLPFITAMLFAVHPIHTEVVAWVGGVTDLAFTLFTLLSLYLYILSSDGEGQRKGLRAFSVASFFLATLAKEPAMVLPLLLAVYDYSFRGRALRPADYVKRYAPYLGAAAVYLVLRVYALGGFAPVRRHGDLGFFEYAINVFPLFRKYLQKLILPVNLNAYHVFTPVTSLLHPDAILSLLVAILFAAALLLAAKKNRPAFFALALVVVPLLPSLYIPGTGENTFAERYLYLPSFGFVLLVALLVERVASYRPDRSVLLAGALLIVSGLYGAGTVQRNAVWRDDEHLWRDVVKHSSNSAVPRYNLACALNAQGRIDEAIGEYRNAIRIQPAAVAYKSLGAAFQAKGLLTEAAEQYEHAVRLQPGDADAHSLLAAVSAESGALDKAIEHFRLAVQLQPDSASAHYNLGTAYLEKGFPREAIPHLESAVRLEPAEPMFRSTLNRALTMQGPDRRGGGKAGIGKGK